VNAAASNVMLRHAIASVRKSSRQILLRFPSDSNRTLQLHNECASFTFAARNFANDRQGYRTVKARGSAVLRKHVVQGSMSARQLKRDIARSGSAYRVNLQNNSNSQSRAGQAPMAAITAIEALVRDLDPGMARPIALDQCEQRRSM
jgi:hypothetical protein